MIKFDIAAEIAAQTAAYTNPLTVAEKIARDYKLMPAPSQEQPSEYWQEREERRQLRIVRADEMADDPRHEP